MFARNKASCWLHDRGPSTTSEVPVFVRCSDDFSSADDSVERVIRRAFRRHARACGLDLPMDDKGLDLPRLDTKLLVLIDGFDEVVLGSREAQQFLKGVRDASGSTRRFVIFSRPAALPDLSSFEGVPIVDLDGLSPTDASGAPGGQVEEWLSNWRNIAGVSEPTAASVAERGLLAIAETPILLFMIATGWGEGASQTKNLASIYDKFFRQLARGKHELDQDQNFLERAALSQSQPAFAIRADLRGANFTSANLTLARFEGALLVNVVR
jgi:Pentapeptide repeats (8 copies)